MKLRVLLVDDEQLAIDRLTDLLGTLEEVEIVGSAHSASEAMERIAALAPDLVFLDIQMPGGSGMALAADLDIDNRPEIIFVTAFEHFAPDAFAVDATDYLLKPVRFDRLRAAVTRAQRRVRLSRSAGDSAAPAREPSPYIDEIWVAVRGGQVRLSISAIEWIEAARDYVMLHTATRSYLHRAQMNMLEEQLDPAQLFRVHRSSFVRLSLVQEIERPGRGNLNLILRDGIVIQVGPSYVKQVLAQLNLS
ncbi:LytR/AlgR family response regulator transcription factor [Sphingopyxis sp. MWB1]|uniref:LytR/AlgR family response regulator transcription factor n=1 Tax=Sphingopyxis sp. MWB1 TaxID=1537715 RepID=UPI00051A1585|nr:LytTR family DNA-binding domain-containing protein [Sphingopyxis sp. MWB1]